MTTARWWERIRAVAHDRRVLAFVVAVGIAVSARELAWSSLGLPTQRLIDFRVFWCGGEVALHGGDPYLVEPLRGCEHGIGNHLLAASPNLVMPFVLPPYDVPVFAALARLPFGAAGALFTGLNCAALLAGILLVARSARVPLLLSAGALGMSVGLPSVFLGQLVPLELAALAGTAVLVARGRDGWAGGCAVLALLEPHVGAFVVVAMAVLLPRARGAIALGLVALAAAAALVGVAGPAAYLAVLTQHAAAEARFYEQYSLTYGLAYAHVPTAAALLAGAASSGALLVAAVALARAARLRGPRAGVVSLPAACAVLGGSFIHITQIALAIPAGLLLFAHAPGRTGRALAALGVVLLAVPWPYPVAVKQTLALTLLVTAITTWYGFGRRLRLTLAVLAVCWLVMIPIENRPPAAVPVPVLAPSPAAALASVPWAAALAQMDSSAPRWLLEKLPTWAGLLAVLGSAFALSRPQRTERADPGAR